MIDLYPAIDVRGGKCVRLRQGDYASETVYDSDPVEVAKNFADAGARWIHVVDLDAARTGTPTNRPVIGAIADAVSGLARVQTGGGVRAASDARALHDLGVARVVMGSAALLDPSLVDQVADVLDVAVGLDHRDGQLAVHGWTEASDVSVDDALGNYPRASAFVITDIARDGMLAGPDVAGLRMSALFTPIPVIASGGVATLEDIELLATIGGLGGIITGKALYEGRFTVADALRILGG